MRCPGCAAGVGTAGWAYSVMIASEAVAGENVSGGGTPVTIEGAASGADSFVVMYVSGRVLSCNDGDVFFRAGRGNKTNPAATVRSTNTRNVILRMVSCSGPLWLIDPYVITTLLACYTQVSIFGKCLDPSLKSIRQICYSCIMETARPVTSDHQTISANDPHPSALGHALIADHLFDHVLTIMEGVAYH